MNDPPAPSDPADSGKALPWDPVRAAVVGLAVDRATAEAVVALRDAGVRAIVLKGPSFDAWLYESGEPRLYGDIDLLIAAQDERSAGPALEALGYGVRSAREPEAVTQHATVWVRPTDGMHVDLHRTLGGVGASGVDPWEVLVPGVESMRVGGTEVEILSEPGRALHVALHAALPGPGSRKTLLDLSRALERLPVETWIAAAELAALLKAQGAFESGLRRLPAGAALADTLELAPERSVQAALLSDSAPYSALTVDRLSNARGTRAKLGILLPRLFPRPDFMRVWYPVAKRGRLGLALAYVRRFAWLIVAAPRAVAAWRRARRRSRGSG